MSTLQTLDRGINALFVVASRPDGISVADLARELGIARANAYRIVATLASHGLLQRGDDGWVRLGAALPTLAGKYWPGFLTRVQPTIQALADRAGATSFVTVAEGDDCVVLLTAEPAIPILRVGYRAGSRHPLSLGAAGIAILSARAPKDTDPTSVKQARATGYSITKGELQQGAVGVAAPVLRETSSVPESSIGIVALDGFDANGAAPLVVEAAREASRLD